MFNSSTHKYVGVLTFLASAAVLFAQWPATPRSPSTQPDQTRDANREDLDLLLRLRRQSLYPPTTQSQELRDETLRELRRLEQQRLGMLPSTQPTTQPKGVIPIPTKLNARIVPLNDPGSPTPAGR